MPPSAASGSAASSPRYRSSGDVRAAPRTPSFAAVEKSLAEGGLLLRHPFARTAWSQADGSASGQALLFVSGESFAMDARSAHVLAAYEALDDAALAKLDDGARRALATLVERGHYHLKRASKTRR